MSTPTSSVSTSARSTIICVNLGDDPPVPPAADSGSKLEEITTENTYLRCIMCKQSTVDEIKLGVLYSRDGVIAHYFCLLFCSNLKQNGGDDEGIQGFLPKDIENEVKRVHRKPQNFSFYKCKFCKEPGATIGCCNSSCSFIYHFPCGLTNAANHRFLEKFESYCSKHARLSMARKIKPGHTCRICSITLTPEDNAKRQIIFGTCCSNVFHKDCLQRYALSAGYMFKCPMCATKQDFKYDVQMQGIFVPDRDALWELEPNAFAELNQLHASCDAEICKCPTGRTNMEKEKESIWYLLRCSYCAGSGIHVGCGTSLSGIDNWICRSCLEVETKMSGYRAKVTRSIPVCTKDDDANDSSVDSVSSSSSSLFSPIVRQHGRFASPSSSASSSDTLFSLKSPPPNKPRVKKAENKSKENVDPLVAVHNDGVGSVKDVVMCDSSSAESASPVKLPILPKKPKRGRKKIILCSSSSDSDEDFLVLNKPNRLSRPKVLTASSNLPSSSIKQSQGKLSEKTSQNEEPAVVTIDTSSNSNDFSSDDSVFVRPRKERRCWSKKRKVINRRSKPSSSLAVRVPSTSFTSNQPEAKSSATFFKALSLQPKPMPSISSLKEIQRTFSKDTSRSRNDEPEPEVITIDTSSSDDDSVFKQKENRRRLSKKRKVVNKTKPSSSMKQPSTSKRSTIRRPSYYFFM